MDLMKLIKGTDIGDCVARLLFAWNADHPDAEKAKETFISAIKARMPQQARLNLSSAEKLSDSGGREFHFGYSGRNCGRPRGTQRNHLFRKTGQGKID